MNPNMTVDYLAIQATRVQVERAAARAWLAEQAAQPHGGRPRHATAPITRGLAALVAGPGLVVRTVTRLARPAGAVAPRFDRVG